MLESPHKQAVENPDGMKSLRNWVTGIVVVLIVVMAVATCIENVKGTAFVAQYVYGSWWFVLLWAVLAVISVCLMAGSKMHRRIPVFLLHLSFLIILAGALTSYLTAVSGDVYLREGETSDTFETKDGAVKELGFPLRLDSFEVLYYPGTDAPSDYVSHVMVGDEDLSVSMNHIGVHNGYRFVQSGYDSDMQGTHLLVLHDTWGILITYSGYALLLLSMLLLLAGKSSGMRHWYKKAIASVSAVVLFSSLNAYAQDSVVPDKQIVSDFGKICVLYNGRVCPVGTVAEDFVTKLSGKAAWSGYSALDVFTGWTFSPMDWEGKKIFRIKDKVARRVLGIDGQWASYDDFWSDQNEYKLKEPLEKAYKDGDLAMVRHLRDADEKFNIIRMFYNGEFLRMFPYSEKSGKLSWIAPGERRTDVELPEGEWMFVRKSLDYVNECVVTGDNAKALMLIGKIRDYQRLRAGEVVPSDSRLSFELAYNTLNSLRWPVMLYLTVSLLLAILYVIGICDRQGVIASRVLAVLMLLHISVLLVLRWVVSGHIPLSNGFETMQFLAFSVLVVTLLLQRKFRIILGFGPLLASFALLVAMIGHGSPQITQLMPVLQSPLLSVHVMVIMFSYSLFGLITFIGIQGLVQSGRGNIAKSESLAALSHFLLYPAVFLLTTGIFIGAVWANVSWGHYWTWDPKEVWALITMLIYMAPLHSSRLRAFDSAKFFHWYCVIAFLSVLITYFGVNFLLGGMHSYA